MELQHRAHIDVYLGESKMIARARLRSRFHEAGFESIHAFDNLYDLGKAVERKAPDLLVADTDLPDGNTHETIKALRHSELGTNPFVPVILTTWSADSAHIEMAVDSGADDLMVKPISPKQLFTQINLLINHRRAFVVTSHFVGPDRRNRGRSEEVSSMPMIEVPNSLREKALGESQIQIEHQERIERARILINQRQLERQTQEAVALTNQITNDYDERQVTNQKHRRLTRLIHIIRNVDGSIEGTEQAVYRGLCDNLLRSAFALREYYRTPKPEDVRVLKPYAAAILSGLFPDSDPVSADVTLAPSTLPNKLTSRVPVG